MEVTFSQRRTSSRFFVNKNRSPNNNVVPPAPTTPQKTRRQNETPQKPTTTTTKRSKVKSSTTESANRTESFEALYRNETQIHTLILGTHPSVASHASNSYYGLPTNAFWWIVGDCLGFRRAEGLKKNGEPYLLTEHLVHGTDRILPYEKQVETLLQHGFALWDVVASCNRKGSLDADIKDEKPNDIIGFCKANPSIKRIVLSNGRSGSTFFLKHFKDWCKSGELVSGTNTESLNLFQKYMESVADVENDDGKIQCVCALPVSPAAARYTYKEKRDHWREYCYNPGLEDYRKHAARTLADK